MPDEKDTPNIQAPTRSTRRESFVKLGLGSMAIAGAGA